MMNNDMLGKLIDDSDVRDAIHIAIFPAEADEKLAPGQDVGLVDYGNSSRVGKSTNPIGIVDPFLKSLVFPGQKFWVLIYPNTITSLRHEWTLPATDIEQTKVSEEKKSMAWLRELAPRLGVPYQVLISEGGSLETGDYINNGENIRDLWYEINDDFWKHHAIVTGRTVAEVVRGGFTCSC